MELRTVNDKKQYGYLKKPLKDMLDFIVDELEKDAGGSNVLFHLE